MRKTLTLLSVCCRCGAWFPVRLLLLSIFPNSMMLPASGLLFCGAVCTVLWKRFCEKRFSKGKSAFFAALIPALLLCCVCVSCLMLMHFSTAVCIAVSCLSLFPVMHGAEKTPEDLCSSSAYAAFLSGCVIVAALLHIAQLPVPLTLILADIGVLSAFWLLLRNQFMLLRMVNRRSVTDTDVPPDIQKYNLKMVFGIIILIAAMLIFRRPLLQLLTWMQEAACAAVNGLFTLLTRFVAWLSSKETALDDPNAASQMQPTERGVLFPLWLLLWIPFFAVAVYIWKLFLSDWYFDIRYWLAAFIKRMRSRRQISASDRTVTEQPDYYDTETAERPQHTARHERREWRRKLRAWMRLPDSTEKFYAGYVLLTEAPAWADTKLLPSDTVREIQKKWKAAHTPPEALDSVTAAYHADRYAEAGLPENAVAELTEALRKLR